jgi:hypothetical protein
MEKVTICFGYGDPWPECRQDCVVVLDRIRKVYSIQQVPLLYRDATPEAVKLLRRTHKRGNIMAGLRRLTDDLYPGSSGGSQHDYPHTKPL